MSGAVSNAPPHQGDGGLIALLFTTEVRSDGLNEISRQLFARKNPTVEVRSALRERSRPSGASNTVSAITGHPNEYAERPIRSYSASLVRVAPGHTAWPTRLGGSQYHESPCRTLRKRILLFALWRSKEVSCLTIGVVCQHTRAAHEPKSPFAMWRRSCRWQVESELRLEVV